MADLADRAQQHADKEAELLLLANRKPVLALRARCYNCNDTMSSLRLFCDQDCREDYEYRAERGIA